MKLYQKLYLFWYIVLSLNLWAEEKVKIKAIGIPLADHYAAVIAYEKYKNVMKKAEYSFLLLPGPNFVRAYFHSEDDADIAFNVSPMVMDMFKENQNFRWVSLIHRDGNALAINSFMNDMVGLNEDKLLRKPDEKIIKAIEQYNATHKNHIEFAVPSVLATHTTVLFKYLKDHNKTLGFSNNDDVRLRIVKPPKSPAYLKVKSTLRRAAGFEQSLPWSDVTETKGYGYTAWYSKDILKHDKGHVECIIIAKDRVIKNKREALQEVIHYIHKAGRDIEEARKRGGEDLESIVKMIRKHIPEHTRDAILESLRTDIMAINYMNLNVDEESKNSFKEIMDLAYEAGFIDEKIDVEALADESFSVNLKEAK